MSKQERSSYSPKIWSHFERVEENGNTRRFKIQDLAEEDRTKCLELCPKFLQDEPICKVLKTTSEIASIDEIKQVWTKFMNQNLSIGCYEVTDEEHKLVGFNVLIMASKNDPEEDIEQFKGESYKQVLRILKAAESTCNIFERYETNSFITSSGMYVLPEYRGQRIGVELLNARDKICKALGINATATVFTAKSSQISAERSGYELLGEIAYGVIEITLNIDLSGINTDSIMLMGKKII